MMLGMWIGERITLRLTREQCLRVLGVVLIGAGITWCFRARQRLSELPAFLSFLAPPSGAGASECSP